ncbi:hypothetical protein [Yinghuangia seranimata]|uniref:hypothetical protein n=1 Tax=Yinghuangia seranimata TaxID=408067 RepID=UPI00248CCE92|nr:hypothetical protein [Yinghuangia seranimata]MDI2126523.1 hypothetical protein [Yinghuangia seranimata]
MAGWRRAVLFGGGVGALAAGVVLVIWSVDVRTSLLFGAVVAVVTALAGGVVVFALAGVRTAVGRFAGEQPVHVGTAPFPSTGDGFRWVVPDVLDAPRSDQPLTQWAQERGGVLAHPYRLDILVEGRAAQAVVLHGLRAVVTERRDAMDGTYCQGVEPTGMPLTPRTFHLDLDADPPYLWPSHHPLDDTPDFPYTVTSGDPELFHVQVTALDADYAWHLELDWTVAGRSGTYVIDDYGKPFTVAAVGSRPELRRETEGWQAVDGSDDRAHLRTWRATQRRETQAGGGAGVS